jgi:hypothetical protein
MKRPTLLFAIALLSLFLSAAFPAGASSLAADRPLQSSRTVRAQPAQVINTLPEGFHESHFEGPQNQFSCFAGGWAADPDDRSADLNIRVFSDNIEVVQTVANLFRQDLYDAGVCGDGTCNFIVDLWGLIAPGVDHSITVQAQDAQTGEWVDLSLTPRTLNCFEENVAPEGFHDFAEGTQNAFSCEAKGWAADPNDRDIDLNVRILSDGVEVAQTVADTFGEGLDEAGACPGGTCRFNVNLWGLISPDTDHLITVQAQDAQSGEWVDLSNTPKTLNCSSAPEGFHDFAEGTQNAFSCVAEGWAADPNDRNIDLNVRILSDGVEVAQTVAGTFREGLEEAGACPGGTCSFSVNLFSLISPDTDHSIAVQAQDAQSGEWVDLSNTPKMLNCIDAGAQPIVWDGFGNPVNSPIEALEVFKGKLYAEATNYEEGATLWRSDNGESWTQVTEPGFDSAYGANNPIVFDMFVFQNQLYAGTGNWTNTTTAGQIWRSSNGTTWSLVAADGLDDPNNTGFTTFASFNGMIYAAALNGSAGAEIWRSSTGGNGDWQQVVADGFGGGPAYFIITSLTTFNDQLYATVEATLGNGAQVWRSANGTSWTQVSEDGFGDIDNYQTGASAVFRGQLYVTTRNDVTGAQLWRTINGTTWQQVVGDGFGDVNNLKIESLVVYNGALYAAANNPVSGVELWRSSDGVHWTQVNADGFGDSGIFVSLWSNGTTVFQGNLLIGSNGPFGGVIWQLEK